MSHFSVLMSIYKGESSTWLEESLDSIVFGSQVTPSQIVCVFDGPVTEQLESVFVKYDSRFEGLIHKVTLPINVGLGRALREGLLHCKYDLVARMDADDVVEPVRFKKQVTLLDENKEVDIVGAMAIDIDGQGREIGIRRVPENNTQIKELLWACPIIHPSVMFRKSKILEAGSYSKYLRRRQDYDLWFRCAKAGCNFYNIQEPLIKYRVTDDSHKRNSLSVAWEQYKIGRNGVKALGLGWRARVGVLYPVIKAVMPLPVRKALIKLVRRFDPRVRKGV